MRWTHRRGALLLALTLSWLGCQSETTPPVEETPPPPSLPSADWEDTGPLAACELPSSSTMTCGDNAVFQMERCDKASLALIPSDGVYTVLYRNEHAVLDPYPTVASFRVSADGSQDQLIKYKAMKQVGPDSFFLTTQWPTKLGTVHHTLAACRADERRIHGCFVDCREGVIVSRGTFIAARAERPAEEPESSGLALVSESFVSQGRPVDVYVTRDHAYVVSTDAGDRRGGLTVFDVSDKAHPVQKKIIYLGRNSYWNGVWAKDNVLYVASNVTGVMVYDISQPDNPLLVRSVPRVNRSLSVHTVFVDGNRLYAMSPSPSPRTLIFDVRSPLAPVLLGEHLVPGGLGSSEELDTTDRGYPHDAFAFEDRLYINQWADGYLIVDVSTPETPKQLGAYKYKFARSHANAVGRFGDRLIAFEGGETWGAHVRVLDVTDPALPKLIGEYRLDPRASVHNMVLKGTRLYVAYYQHGVRVLDVSTPEQPVEVAHYNTYRESDPNRGQSFYEGAFSLRVPGDGYVYAVDDSRGLLIFSEPP